MSILFLHRYLDKLIHTSSVTFDG